MGASVGTVAVVVAAAIVEVLWLWHWNGFFFQMLVVVVVVVESWRLAFVLLTVAERTCKWPSH